MNGKAASTSKLTRSSATNRDAKPCARRMERKLSLQALSTTSCHRIFQDSRSTDHLHVDRHAKCRAAPMPPGVKGPAWNESTKITPSDRKSWDWLTTKKGTSTKSTKKAEQNSVPQEKTRETHTRTTSGPSTTSTQLTVKLPDFSFLFKIPCFSPKCSDPENHFPVWPQTAKSND